jgi:type II secretion system protein D
MGKIRATARFGRIALTWLALASGVEVVCGQELPVPALARADEKKAEPVPPPKAEDKPAPEKTVVFEMRDKPWSSVLEWLSEQTGLPVITTAKPTGTFTFIAPRTGANKKAYTIPEVIDILNEALFNQKYLLIRREASLTIVPADEQIDRGILPRITADELPKRGRTEIVTLVLPLQSLVAEDIATEIKKMMGPFGEVVAMSKANQLVLQDTAGNLTRILKTIREIEENEKGQAESFSYTCQFVKARDAERILRELLGDPKQMLAALQQALQPRMDRGDPRMDPRAAPTPPANLPKIRMYYLTADERSNSILVTGPADKIAQAKDILKKIDVAQPGQKTVIAGPPFLKSYPVTPGSADAVSKTLTEIYKASPSIRISAVGNNQVMVWATPEDQFDIAKHITGATETKATPTELLMLTTLDAAKTADTLKGMFGDAKTGGPYIEADGARNAIIAKGTAEQVADIKAALKALGEAAVGAPGVPQGNLRIINLDKGSAATLAEELKRLLGEMKRNPVKIITPGEQPKEAPPPKPGPAGNGQIPPGLRRLPDERLIAMADEKVVPKARELPPVVITPVGNRLLVTSDDPEALQLVQDLVRLLTRSDTGDGDFEVIRLKNASAVEAAKVLDEAFNGPKQPAQQSSSPFNPFFGRFGAPGATTPTPTPGSVRIVADPGSNSLLIKAKPLDLASIRRLLDKAIDSGEAESRAIAKQYIIGPLKFASASEVAATLRDVFRDQMSGGSTTVGGFPGFGFGFSGLSRSGSGGSGSKPATLSIGVDDRSNSLVVQCNEAVYEDVTKLVTRLDVAAKDATRTIAVVPVQGIDPNLVQQAIDAIQGRTSTSTPQRGGQNSFGNTGSIPFGITPTFPGSSRGFGGTSGSGRGTSGTRGFGRPPQRAEENPPGSGGRDFFDQRDTDVPPSSQLYDPQDEQPQELPVSLTAPAHPTAPGVQPARYEEQQPPPMPNNPAAPLPGTEIPGLRSNVSAEALEELGLIIISGNNKTDVDEVRRIIETIVKIGGGAEPQLEIVPLKHADATSITGTLNQVFARLLVGPTGNVTTPTPSRGLISSPSPFLPANQALTTSQGTVTLIPLPRFNAVLVVAPKARLEYVKGEIGKLDQPTATTGQATAFPLKRAAASRVANLVQQFYAQRYPNEQATQNQVRVSYDDSTNTVFVQAAPADLAEIRALIERIDNNTSQAINDVKIVRLRNALADELAQTLLQAITTGIVPSTGTGVPQVPGATQGQLGGQFGGQFGQQGGQQNRLNQQNQANQVGAGTTTKTTGLRFVSTTKGVVESGFLEDVHIIPEVRSNTLLVSAPPKTVELILALVRELDVVAAARAEINIYPLKKADAQQTAALIQQLFLGTTSGTTTTPGQQRPGGPLNQAANTATQTGTQRPLLSLTGQPSDGATLIDLKISVDDRTNSIIVAGSRNDLETIEAIIAKLEDSDPQLRRNEVYKLRNAAAADVAQALQTFLTNSLQVLRNSSQLTAFQEIQREVVVVAEPVSNSLLVSATPQYYADIQRLIAQLDTCPPQVMIQVLVAEVQLNNSEEFGVEIGLQSPILFSRSVVPQAGALGDGSVTYTSPTAGVGTVPPGVTVNNSINPTAFPGFAFNNPAAGLGTNPLAGPGIVGFQGLGNLGTGRTSPTGSGVGGLVFSAASDTFSLLIRALKTQGRVDILSRPQVMALDNQTAFIQVGQSIPYVTASNIGALGNVVNTVNYRDVGIILRVTPRISPDGRVLMRVEPEVSSVAPTTVNLGNNLNATAFNVQQVSTTVAASDGETVAIGGLIQRNDNKTENKVPWLGDLPYVGAAFRFRTQSKFKRELLVILTPHVVRSPMDLERVSAEEAKRMDWIPQDIANTHGPGGMDHLLPQLQQHPPVGGPPGPLPGEAPLIPQPAPVPPPATLPMPRTVPVPSTPAPITPASASEPKPAAKPAKKGGLFGP